MKFLRLVFYVRFEILSYLHNYFLGRRKLSSIEYSLIECDSWDFVNKGQCFDLFIFDHQTGAAHSVDVYLMRENRHLLPSLVCYTWMSRPPHPWIRECSIIWCCCWRGQEGNY